MTHNSVEKTFQEIESCLESTDGQGGRKTSTEESQEEVSKDIKEPNTAQKIA